jgi:hypothetical protein
VNREVASPSPTGQGLRGPGERYAVRLAVLHLSLLLLYALLSPAWQAPDELAHGDLTLGMLEVSGFPQAGERFVSRRTIASRNDMAWSKDAAVRVREDAPPRPRRSLEDLAPDEPSSQLNAATQHPPLYYAVSSVFLAATTGAFSLVGTPSHDQVHYLMRVFNILLVLPLPLLAFRAARQLGVPTRGASLAAATTLVIPQLTYVGSSINNDNAVVLAFAVLSVLLARVVTGDLSGRTAVLVGVVSAAASLSKVFGLASIPWAAAAYLIAARSTGETARTLRVGVLAIGTGAIAGGWWFARNLLTTGSLQPLVRDRTPRASFTPDAAEWLQEYPSRVMQSFWGNFGYLDVPIPGWLVVAATTATVVVLVLAMVRRAVPMSQRLLMFTPIMVVVLGNAVQHWLTIYPRVGGFAGSQGRYLFAAVPAVAVLIGISGTRTPRPRAWLLAILGFGAVLHLASLLAILQAYWGLDQGIGYALLNVLAWSPVPGWVGGLVLLSAPVASVWIVHSLITTRAAGGRTVPVAP